jgi:hypothetical protein
VNRGTRNRLLIALVLFAILFSAVAWLQYWFVSSQLRHSNIDQIDDWADQITEFVDYKDRWDLSGYRRSNPQAPIYYIVTPDGFLADEVGLNEGMMPPVSFGQPMLFDQPFDLVSKIGERWRLYAVRVRGGSVILGVPYSESHPDLDDRLRKNRSVFGPTIDTAAQVEDKQVDLTVDYAVVDNSGWFKNGSGGIPLSTNPNEVEQLLQKGPIVKIDGDPYFQGVRKITNSAGRLVATIVLFKDVGLEQQMLKNSLWFNLGVAGLCWIGSGLLFGFYLYSQSGPRITCEQAIAQDEGQTIEFKSSFRWDYKQEKENRPAIEGEIIKTVAAFLNSDGGVLMIGVSDDKTVLGLEPDYRTITSKPNKDGFLLTLQQVLSHTFGTETFTRYLRIEFCTLGGKDICVVYVKPARTPRFVEERGQKNFYVRVENATKLLNAEEMLAYVRDHFG